MKNFFLLTLTILSTTTFSSAANKGDIVQKSDKTGSCITVKVKNTVLLLKSDDYFENMEKNTMMVNEVMHLKTNDNFIYFTLCHQRVTASDDFGNVYWDKIYITNCETGQRAAYWDLLTNEVQTF